MGDEPTSKREPSLSDELFGARALESREKARTSNRYHSVADVIAALETQLKVFLTQKR